MTGLGRGRLLATAAAAGLLAALLAYALLARQTRGAGAQEAHQVVVVAAARDLPARCPLTAALLQVRRLPASEAPPGAVGTPEALVGQVTSVPISAGHPVTRGMVTARSASPGIAWAVASFHRAVSVPLDPVSGVAGFLEPGDHVDVLATFGTGDGQGVTRTVVQDARLLAIGSRTEAAAPSGEDPVGEDAAAKPATSATLEVTPGGAQALALASARGKLQLALRGLGDEAQSPVADLPSAPSAVTPAPKSGGAEEAAARPRRPHLVPASPPSPAPPDLGAGGADPPRPLVPPVLPQIKVIRGTETTTVTVGE